MPQVNGANGYESEGFSALKGTATKARNIAVGKVVRAAASKAASSLGLPVLIGIAVTVLAVVAGIVIIVFVVLSSAGGGGKDVTQPGQVFYGFKAFSVLKR